MRGNGQELLQTFNCRSLVATCGFSAKSDKNTNDLTQVTQVDRLGPGEARLVWGQRSATGSYQVWGQS